jgi:serralysin
VYTSTEIALLREADPGVVIPGIDTETGNPLSSSSLLSLSSLSTNPTAGIYYDAVNNRVVINQAGATLSGYNLGTATVVVNADNVTISDDTFTGTTGWYAVQVEGGHGNTTITNDTFDGGGTDLKLAAWVVSSGEVTITDNSFIDTPSDGLDLSGSGVVSGNYFSGAGYTSTGAHPDAIWVTDSSGPLTISDNFIDWSTNSDSNFYTNDAIRITAEEGSVSNVTVTGNFLLGGSTSIDAGNAGTDGTFSNITITGNYIGFAEYYTFYPGPMTGVTASDNTIIDYTNTAYATDAWAAYVAAGIPTPYLEVSTSGATILGSSVSGAVTLYGSASAHVYGGNSENNIVAGLGREYLFGGAGKNIFTYLTPTGTATDSSSSVITNFDPAKDVINLSSIDADLSAAGVQSFTFIGTDAFTSSGAEVRYQQNTTTDTTTIQVAMAGDSSSDLTITINGLLTLTSDNFALTASQAASDFSAGAALSETSLRSGSATEYTYSNVEGRSYSSYESFENANYVGAEVLNLSSTSDEVDPIQSGVTLTRGGSSETVAIGTGSFSVGYKPTETINAGGAGADTFTFNSGFGSETISNLSLSGSNADTVDLSTAAFSYLNSSMTQAQDLAAVLAHAASGSSAITLFDTAGDRLSLAGQTSSTLAAAVTAGTLKFV